MRCDGGKSKHGVITMKDFFKKSQSKQNKDREERERALEGIKKEWGRLFTDEHIREISNDERNKGRKINWETEVNETIRKGLNEEGKKLSGLLADKIYFTEGEKKSAKAEKLFLSRLPEKEQRKIQEEQSDKYLEKYPELKKDFVKSNEIHGRLISNLARREVLKLQGKENERTALFLEGSGKNSQRDKTQIYVSADADNPGDPKSIYRVKCAIFDESSKNWVTLTTKVELDRPPTQQIIDKKREEILDQLIEKTKASYPGRYLADTGVCEYRILKSYAELKNKLRDEAKKHMEAQAKRPSPAEEAKEKEAIAKQKEQRVQDLENNPQKTKDEEKALEIARKEADDAKIAAQKARALVVPKPPPGPVPEDLLALLALQKAKLENTATGKTTQAPQFTPKPPSTPPPMVFSVRGENAAHANVHPKPSEPLPQSAVSAETVSSEKPKRKFP